MSSYARYCRDQAAECARRARLASSPEIAAERRNLEQRWLKLAERAQTSDRAFGWAKPAAAARSSAVSAQTERREAARTP